MAEDTQAPKDAFHATVLASDEEEGKVGVIHLEVHWRGFLSKVFLRYVDHVPAAQWRELAMGVPMQIDLCKQVGCVYASGRGGEVGFMVESRAAGFEGSISVKVPGALCREALLHVSARVAEIHALRRVT